ncbi:MAG: MBL fold metallo-hydrolase [Proteobacteria bacterium]|nr:MBL fold metallo-hydrolase [Pseudomonadota bacterium]
MAKWRYEKGLHDLGNDTYAYLQPDGSWGWSNAGLIVNNGRTLLVDTLFDLKLTREMLDTMRAKVPASKTINTLVNTHANGDHTYGNQLVKGADIIASSASAEEMDELPPEALAKLMQAAPGMGETGKFLLDLFDVFDFEGIRYTPPNLTFDEELTITVGDREVRLVEVGPAHTKGDVLVYLPSDKTVFTGDILFVKGHPIVWAGPVDNWIKACDLMLGWDLETVVPGHGPITDKSGIREMREFLVYIKAETRKRFDAGLSVTEAANDISLDMYGSWSDAERIVVNVDALYREFHNDSTPTDIVGLFGLMATYHRAHAGGPGRA